MASQIEQLRISFAKMDKTQKKAFIDKLKLQLKGSTNAEHIKFLNECVSKYNAEIRQPTQNKNVLDDLLDDSGLKGDYKIAEPAERLIAYLFDMLFSLPGIVLIYVAYFLSLIAIGMTPESHYSIYYGSYTSGDSNLSLLFSILTLVSFLAALVYSIIVLVKQIKYWKKGTSFGKNKRNLIVVNKETGKKITTGYMFLREIIGKWISGLVFSLGFIWILLDKDKQAWHDKLVSSVVVKK